MAAYFALKFFYENVLGQKLDERSLIHSKTAKGEKQRVIFLHDKLKTFIEYFNIKKKELFCYLISGKSMMEGQYR